MKYLIIIISLPFLIFAKSSILPDSSTIIQNAIKKANDDWNSGNASYIVPPNTLEFRCFVDSATGLKYATSVRYYDPWNRLRISKYMEELLRLCNTKGLPVNNYHSIRNLICSPREFVVKNFESKVQIIVNVKKSIRIRLNNSNTIYTVGFYYASKYNDVITLSFYDNPSQILPIGTLKEGSTLYYLSGPEDIGYFIIINEKYEINSILCLDMKKQCILSRTHNKGM